ncbi:MAG TPA: MFS transporter [Bacteroidota bacterium]|nr:MFS transporter [Bacteroidota bacterium]
MAQTFAALQHRNYRLWFTGQVVSLFGTWMQVTAQGFLIYQLTKSPAFLGFVGFANGLPSLVLMLYAGVIADRFPRRSLLLATQTTMMILAFILTILTFFNVVAPWHIILLAFFLGIANAFDAPARLAFIPQLVPKERLTNAIALNAMMMNTATTLGPGIAGVIYATMGPAWCFAFNGVSFLAVIGALLMIHPPAQELQRIKGSTLSNLKIGVSYVLHTPTIRTLILMVGATSLFGMSMGTLIPAWSVKVLHGNAATNGLLQSARGIGSLIGAFVIASVGHLKVRGKMVTFGSCFLPVFAILFALTTWLPLSFVLIGCLGMASILIVNDVNALVTSTVPENIRGRAMSVYSMMFFGSMPIGALMYGSLAEHFGEFAALVFSGGCLAFIALSVWIFAPTIRSLE